MSASLQDPRHRRLPAERFYFALLDTSQIPRARFGVDETKLGYLFEDVLPCPIEMVAASFVPIDAKRVLACGIEREALEKEDLDGVRTLAPNALPEAVAHEIGPSDASRVLPQLNVLVGEFEPKMLRAARRRRTTWLGGASLLATVFVIVGLEARMAALHDRLASIEAHETHLLDTALGRPAPGVGNAQRRAALIGERRQLERTRGARTRVAKTTDVDVAARFAALLRAWPSEPWNGEIDSLAVDARGIEIRGSAENTAAEQALVDALGTQAGLEAEPPRFRANAEGKAEFELGWTDRKNAGGAR